MNDEKLSALISTALIESSKCSITVLLHEFEFISSLLVGLNSFLIVSDSFGSIFGTFSEIYISKTISITKIELDRLRSSYLERNFTFYFTTKIFVSLSA